MGGGIPGTALWTVNDMFTDLDNDDALEVLPAALALQVFPHQSRHGHLVHTSAEGYICRKPPSFVQGEIDINIENQVSGNTLTEKRKTRWKSTQMRDDEGL